MLEYVKLDDVVYFSVNYHNPNGGFSVPLARMPQWFVYRGTEPTPILQGPMVARNITGSYMGSFVASSGIGFEKGQFYDVQISGVLNNKPVFTSAKQFVLEDVMDVNVVTINGVAPNVVQKVDANIVSVDNLPVTIDDFNRASGDYGDTGLLNNILTYVRSSGVVVSPSSKSGYSLTPISGLGNQTANITGNLFGSVGSVAASGISAASIAGGALNGKGDWPVGKTGYSLTPISGLGNQTATITGNLTGSVGTTPCVLHTNGIDFWTPETLFLNLTIHGLLPTQYDGHTVVVYGVGGQPSIRKIVSTLSNGLVVDSAFDFVPTAGNLVRIFLGSSSLTSVPSADEVAGAVYNEITTDHTV